MPYSYHFTKNHKLSEIIGYLKKYGLTIESEIKYDDMDDRYYLLQDKPGNHVWLIVDSEGFIYSISTKKPEVLTFGIITTLEEAIGDRLIGDY